MPRAIALRILFDKNVPVGLRRFLPEHEVRTIEEMSWPPQIENGQLIAAAEASGFEILITADQNIRFQQNLDGRRLAILTLGSNIWPLLRSHASRIASQISDIAPGSIVFLEIPHVHRRE